MDIAGNLKIHSSQEIEQSYVSIGFEMLDRDMFDPERCYDLIECRNKICQVSDRLGKNRKRKRRLRF